MYYYSIVSGESLMTIQNAVVETATEEQPQVSEQKQEPAKASREPVMKAILLKKGEYMFTNSLVLPSVDVCLLGEQDTVLVPAENVLTILGVGNKDIKCSKCGYVLAMKIKKPQLQNLAIKCPSCGTVNQF